MKDVQYFCTSFFETNCVFKSSHTTFAWISCAWYNEKNIERRIAMHDFLIFLAVTVFIFVPLTIGITISLENRSPHKTISWLLVLMFLPGVGFLLYLIFGANTRKHRWENAKARIVAYLNHADMREILDAAEALPVADDPADSKLFDLADQNTMRLVLNSGVSPLTVRNKVDIYTDGVAKFAQMLEDIKNAREHIHLEYSLLGRLWF